MDIEAQADEVVQQLRELGSKERVDATLNYFPTQQENLGVSVPKLRGVVREFARLTKSESERTVVRFALAIIARKTLEGRQCAYEIVAKHKATLRSLKMTDLKRLVKGADNWVSVDVFATMICGPVWRNGQVSDANMEGWGASKDPWLRRVVLASTVALNLKARGGTGDVPRTIAACERAVSDEHVMVHKALSWALRTLIGVDRKPVERFMKQHDAELPALVKREVRKKLATGRKSG